MSISLISQPGLSDFSFEKRIYGQDSTEEEIEALKSRVILLDGRIVYFKEIPVVSSFTANVIFDKKEELLRAHDARALFIDVSETKVPDAETRRTINRRFKSICNEVDHVAFCTGKNAVINTVIRFVMYGINVASFSVNRTFSESVERLNSELND